MLSSISSKIMDVLRNPPVKVGSVVVKGTPQQAVHTQHDRAGAHTREGRNPAVLVDISHSASLLLTRAIDGARTGWTDFVGTPPQTGYVVNFHPVAANGTQYVDIKRDDQAWYDRTYTELWGKQDAAKIHKNATEINLGELDSIIYSTREMIDIAKSARDAAPEEWQELYERFSSLGNRIYQNVWKMNQIGAYFGEDTVLNPESMIDTVKSTTYDKNTHEALVLKVNGYGDYDPNPKLMNGGLAPADGNLEDALFDADIFAGGQFSSTALGLSAGFKDIENDPEAFNNAIAKLEAGIDAAVKLAKANGEVFTAFAEADAEFTQKINQLREAYERGDERKLLSSTAQSNPLSETREYDSFANAYYTPEYSALQKEITNLLSRIYEINQEHYRAWIKSLNDGQTENRLELNKGTESLYDTLNEYVDRRQALEDEGGDLVKNLRDDADNGSR